MQHHPYRLHLPQERTSSVVFASPHSGRDYPRAFMRRSVLDANLIRSSEDAFVDQLFENAPAFGAPLLAATAPRAFLDLNRAAEELDSAVIDGIGNGALNPRVASGLGVIPRVVANGRAIYRGKISRTEAHQRVEEIWHPYHDALQGLLRESSESFGQAILIDCHSMPHDAIDSVARQGIPRPEIVIGDRYGAAADGDIVERIEDAFLRAGLKVVRNAPFAGAFIVQHYGRPSKGQHAIQIEIDRSLYMDEKTIRPNSNFAAFKRLLDGIIEDITDIGCVPRALAAE